MKQISKKLYATFGVVSIAVACVGVGCQTVSDAAAPVEPSVAAEEAAQPSAKELATEARNMVLEAGYDSLDLQLFNDSERYFLTAADRESEGDVDEATNNYITALDGYQQLITLGKTVADRLRALANAEYQEALNEERLTEAQFEAILQDGLGQTGDSSQVDTGDSLLLDDMIDMDDMTGDDMDDVDKTKDDMMDMDDMTGDDMDDMNGDDMDKTKDDMMDMDDMKDGDMDKMDDMDDMKDGDMDKMKDGHIDDMKDDMMDMDDMNGDDMDDMDKMKDGYVDDMDDMEKQMDEGKSEDDNDA